MTSYFFHQGVLPYLYFNSPSSFVADHPRAASIYQLWHWQVPTSILTTFLKQTLLPTKSTIHPKSPGCYPTTDQQCIDGICQSMVVCVCPPAGQPPFLSPPLPPRPPPDPPLPPSPPINAQLPQSPGSPSQTFTLPPSFLQLSPPPGGPPPLEPAPGPSQPLPVVGT